MLDILDHNEPAVNATKRTLEDLLRVLDEKPLAVLKKNTNTNAAKYDDVRNKLKEKDGVLTQEIIDSERFVEVYYSVEMKYEMIEVLLKDIKKCSQDPDLLDEGLLKTKEIIIYVEEIFEFIIIIEEVLIIIRSYCKGHPPILKQIDTKASTVTNIKKKALTAKKVAQDTQKKMNDMQQSNKEVDQHILDLNDWLPSMESDLVKETPVSANYNILKNQQEKNQVSLNQLNLF